MLGLWMYHWDATTWGGAPPEPEPPPVVVGNPSNAGGGRYDRALDADYWETRERYIRRMLRVAEIPLPHAPSTSPQPSDDATPAQPGRSESSPAAIPAPADLARALEEALARQALAVERAREAQTRAELQLAGAAIVAVTLEIARLRDMQELEMLAILLASTL